MRKALVIAKRFVTDECAAEVTELGIMLAAIVALAIVPLVAIGGKVLAAYNTVNGAIP